MLSLIFWVCVGSILYTYAGYPLCLAVLARLRPAVRFAAADPPPVTLLIAAYNEAAVIAHKLENALALDYPPGRLQILVAADGAADETPAIVRRYAGRGVELSFAPERCGKMAAINRAMAQARGDIVVFSDANNFYDAAALRALTAPFADPQVGAVSGAKVIGRGDGALGESEGLYWRYEALIKKLETRLGSCTGVSGEILALRRRLFQPPPAQVINDDFYLAMQVIRQGYRVVYAPAARSTERVSLSARDEMARRARIIAGRYQALALAPRWLPWRQPVRVWQIASHKFLRPLVPVAMLGALLANVALVVWPPVGAAVWLAPPFNWLMLALQGAFYGLAGLGQWVGRRGRLGRLLYLPAFLVNSNLAALIGLGRFILGRQTVLWQRAPRRAPDAEERRADG